MRVSALYNFVAVSLKRVDVINNFLISIGVVSKEHAYKTRYTAEQYEIAIVKTADEIERLRAMLPKSIPFAVFIAPVRFEIRDDDPPFRRLRLIMVGELEKRGIRTLDPFEGFKAAGFAATHFVHDGHWSPAGHRIAGETISRWLKNQIEP
jgi:hypothetical protein